MIATAAANTEVLQELKLVFTNYFTKLKDTSAPAQPVKPTTTTEVACSHDAVDDDGDTLDFDSEDATLPKDSKDPGALPKSTESSPPLAAVTNAVQLSKAKLAAPQGKAVVPKKPAPPGTKLKGSALKDIPTDPATAATLKDAEKDAELRKGSHELKTGRVEEGSSAGAMHHAADKLLEAANMPADTMPKTTLAGPSPKKQKKQRPPSPPKVDAPALDVEEASTQVSSDDRVEPRKSPVRVEMSKLLVFNVHGTLLDCSLLQNPDPNSSIRYTMKTPTRRVVCRPWMAEFLSRCFDHFEVAFWGNKSAAYMEDLVPAMLRRVNEDRNLVPLFVWSQRECEPI